MTGRAVAAPYIENQKLSLLNNINEGISNNKIVVLIIAEKVKNLSFGNSFISDS
jgi:hypothetical protein